MMNVICLHWAELTPAICHGLNLRARKSTIKQVSSCLIVAVTGIFLLVIQEFSIENHINHHF